MGEIMMGKGEFSPFLFWEEGWKFNSVLSLGLVVRLRSPCQDCVEHRSPTTSTRLSLLAVGMRH